MSLATRLLRLFVLVAVLALAVAGVSAQDATEEAGPADELIAQLPEELAGLYDGIADSVMPSAYDDYEAPEAPWTVCHSESFMGNPWRVAFNDAYQHLVGVYQDEGLIEDFQFADSNGDVALQISQIRNFIDRGCDVITSIAGSATGLDAVIEEAYNAGIPFITIASPVTSPYAINIGLNPYVWGRDMANYICEALGGEGNVLFVEGIPGQPIVALENAGGEEGFANCPGLNILPRVSGEWSPTVTKNVVLQVLATNPTPIDAVWTTGSETAVVAQAFREAGRPLPLITGTVSGDSLGYWAENEDFNYYGGPVTPAWHGQVVFRVAMRMLMGQQPRLNRLIIPLPSITNDDLADWYRDCMTPETGSIFPVPPEDIISEDLLNEYFVNGEAIPHYDYATQPDPCDAVES